MSTTTETQRRARRSNLHPAGRTEILPPEILSLPGMPEPIVTAGRTALAAVEAHEAAQRAAGEAHDALQAAPSFDAHAAAAAVAVGEVPPAEITPTRRAEHDRAQRALAATEQAAKDAVRALYDAIENAYPAYLAAIENATREMWEPLRDTMPALIDRLIAFREINASYQLARRFHNNPTSAALSSNQSPGSLRRRFDKEFDSLLGLARQREFTSLSIPNELPRLLAAAHLHLEREASGLAVDSALGGGHG